MAENRNPIARTLPQFFLLTAALIVAPIKTVFAETGEPWRWSGDLRYRFVQLKEGSDDTRLYQQLRARLGLRAKIQDDLTAVLRLATATSAISNNQTLGDAREPGMPRRSFGIDHAYGEWSFTDYGRTVLGRGPNPFFAPGKTQLVFDTDLAFEGASVGVKPEWSNSSAFANLGAFIISENYSAPSDTVDTGLLGLNIGYVLKSADLGQLTVSASRFHYLNIADRPITSVEKDAKTDSLSSPFLTSRGNTVYAANPAASVADRRYLYQFDFVQSELGLEWKLKALEAEFTLFADYVLNERASASGQAFEVGLGGKYGRGSATVAFAEKKSDSVVGAFTDSDFNGGGTDNRGVKLSASYQMSDASFVTLSHYQATRGIDTTSRNYQAQQLDLSLQF